MKREKRSACEEGGRGIATTSQGANRSWKRQGKSLSQVSEGAQYLYFTFLATETGRKYIFFALFYQTL